MTGALGRTISGAILLREAARTSRRWQTYFARTAFSGVLMGVLLLGMWAAVNATRTALVDTANLAWLGRGLFVGFSVTQTLLAIVIAPLTTASAIIEETDERTMEMLVLTPLRPGQILGAKVLSRIGVLITVVCGALPVMALVVNLGGVSGVEVLAVTVHTLTTVVLMASLGAFFALFTKSPALAMMASAGYAVPFFILLPAAYAIATSDPSDAAQFSTFAAGMAKDGWALVTPLSFLPSLVVVTLLATPLFQLKVSNADFRHAFSEQVWHTTRWLGASGIAVGVATVTMPVAVPLAWWLQNVGSPPFGVLTAPIHAMVLGWIWVVFTALGALATWAYLRVGMDVVDGIDGVFAGDGFAPVTERVSRTVEGANPVWWREARPRAWMSTAAPIFVTWGLILLGLFQTGWWILPGGLLAIGAGNGVAAMVFGSWLAARTVSEERRRGTLEVLLATTLPSRSIVVGKFAGSALPTVPLLLVSLPLVAIGLPHLHFVSLVDGASGSFGLFARGVATWFWMVPVWVVAIAASMAAATRMAKPQSAFSTVMVGLVAWFGIPAVLARVFPDTLFITLPARLIAPPLAGGFAWWHLGLSMIGISVAAGLLLTVTTRRMREWIGAGAVLLLGLALAGRAEAVPPPDPEFVARLEQLNRLKMVARPIADGISREGQFTTVWIQVENTGPGTVGTVSLSERSADDTTRTWERRIELPEGTRKELVFLFEPGIGDSDRLLELVTREGRRALAPFRLRPTGRDDVTIGVIGTDPMGLPAILPQTTAEPVPGRVHRPAIGGGSTDGSPPSRAVRTGLVSLPSLPHQSAGFGALDWVIWPDADPSGVSAGQVEALRAWVADGGHLLVGTTDTWRQVAGSPLAPALPLVLEGQRDADPLELASLLGLGEVGVTPIAVGTVRDDREVAVRARTADGAPLWVSAPYGLGSVHVVTVDLGLARGREAAWRRLLTLPVVGGNAGDQLAIEPGAANAVHRMLNLDVVLPPTEVTYDEQDPELAWEGRVREWLSNIPGVAPLPLSWLVAFSAVYLLTIGPLDFLVLRAIGRQPLTWITFPVSIAVFSAASLFLTSYTKGSQAVVMRVEIVDLLPGTELARGSTWLGVFSTRKTDLELTSGYDDAVLLPLDVAGFQNAPVIEAGGGAGRLGYGAETWTLAYARSDWTAPMAGGLAVRQDGERWFVHNTLGFDLDDVGLSIPDPSGGRVAGWARLGTLADGAEIEVPRSPTVHTLASARPDDPLEWALETFAPSFPTSRGAIRADARVLFVGIADHPIEPITLSGLSPVERPLTVVRMALPSIPIDMDLDRAAVIVAIDPALQVSWATVACGDDESRTASVVDGQLRFDDVEAQGCTLQVYSDLPVVEHPVVPGMRGSCRPRNGTVVCTLESP